MSTAISAPVISAKARAWNTVLLLLPLLIGGGVLLLRQMEVNRLAERQIQNLGWVPPFQLLDQNGQSFGSANLTRKIWIADFIYSTCPGPCPMISSRMSEMQKPLEKTDVQFVSFTVDPEKDTPTRLHEYADRLNASPDRWHFLTGAKTQLYDLIEHGFKLAASENGGEKGQPLHSTRMVLIDRRGQIRGYYDALGADAITKLLADTSHLLKEQPQ